MSTDAFGSSTRRVVAALLALCMLPSTVWPQTEDAAPQSVVVSRGYVAVKGGGASRVIDKTGRVQHGEWLEPSAGAVAYLIRDTGLLLLQPGKQTQVVAARSTAAPGRGMLALFVDLALPRDAWGPAAASKGDPQDQAISFRAIYPRDSKVAEAAPQYRWTGGSGAYEIRLYRRGTPGWIWKRQVRGITTRQSADEPLQDGQSYTWEVRDLDRPENVDVASFDTVSGSDRKRLLDGIAATRAACARAAIAAMSCELAVAGFYRREGHLYEAIMTLQKISTPAGADTVLVASLLAELTGENTK